MRTKVPPNETVGPLFDDSKLIAARDKTLELIQLASKQIKAGMTESEAKSIIETLQKELGSDKRWHPPQIRFGENTLLPFGVPGKKDVPLKENDIYFLDLGPVFDDHEGDVGRPFVIGSDPEMIKCQEDAEKIWHVVQDHWSKTKATGAELYAFAEKTAEEYGWTLNLQKANGHRIGDFPHAAPFRGSIEGWETHPQPNRWILEIQIQHPTRPFGAFYEDLLN